MKLNDFFDHCYVYETVDKSSEWMEQRKTGIGGSEVSIILNINKYKTPYELFMEKKGNSAAQHITNTAIEKGNRLEQPLIDVFFALHPEYIPINTKSISLKSKQYEFMNANLDGALLDQEKNKCILEIKTTTIQNRDMLHDWGYWDNEHGVWIERVPDAYYCQVLHYLIVTGFDKAVIYAMLDFAYKDGQETREITIHKEDVIEDMQYIITEEKKFWKMLEDNTPPPFMKMNFR